MSRTSTHTLSRKLMSTKIIMGLMVAAVSVLVSTAGVAGATSGHGHGHGSGMPPMTGYGGTNISTNINIGNVIGNNNVIVVVINYFSGH